MDRSPDIIRRGGKYLRDKELHIGATPMPSSTVPCGHGVIQIKSVEPSIFRKTWMQEGEEPTPPAWIMAQVIVEAILAGVA